MTRQVRFDEPVAVIGDIHGRLDLLDALLEHVADVPLIVIGDVGDRGPDTRGVIDRLVERGAVGVIGNHDEWLRRWARREGFDSFALHPVMGGRATLDSYGVTGTTSREIEAQAWRVPDAHRRWLDELALVIDLEVRGQRYWVTHAGIPASVRLPEMPAEHVVPWLAEHHARALVHDVTSPEKVCAVDRPIIMGHVPLVEPFDLGHVIAIDTGAGTFKDGGRLTAVLLPERRFVTVGPLQLRP